MKNMLLFLIINLSLFFAAEIQNIQVAQRTNGTGIVDLSYDLIDAEGVFPSFEISIEISTDGVTYNQYNSALMTGDVGENVLPGTGKSIQVQAPENIYTSNAVFKIIASAQVVVGNLPFNLVAVSVTEGVSSYQGESISYSFEIMQNELTNTNLVTFLQNYEFAEVIDVTYNQQNGLNDSIALPIYDCSNYYNLHNSPFNQSNSNDGMIWGCIDFNALNFNVDANEDNGTCIYSYDIGCIDEEYEEFDGLQQYSDCSCNINTDQIEFNFESASNWDGGGCTVEDWYNSDLPFDSAFGGNFSDSIVVNVPYCSDPNAINYDEVFANECSAMQTNNGTACCIESSSTCVYECDESYLDFNTSPADWYGTNSSETINIQDFSTEDVWFEGASFVIASGEGDKPVQFSFDKCIDAVIVSLMLDYYGLRIPTIEEWTKASRGDNTRCWPWMGSDCENEATTFCNTNQVQSDCIDFNYDDCISNNGDDIDAETFCSQLNMECQQNSYQISNCIEYATDSCEKIYNGTLTDIITNPDEYASNGDYQEYLYNLFNNRFFYEKIDFDWNSIFNDNVTIILPDTTVQSYPLGVSVLGLYDVIGNLPEIVKHDNNYWLVGTTPTDNDLVSFCKDDATLIENGHAKQLTSQDNSPSYENYPIYGLRMIRTTLDN